MATKKMTATPKTKTPVEEPVVEKQEVVEKQQIKKALEKTRRKDTDLIPCVSVTAGELLVVGDKTKLLYSWVGEGDIVDVEYQDIVSAIRSKKPCVFKPRFIINDDELVDEYDDVKKLYESLYSKDNLSEIFNLQPSAMRDVINSLPDGAKDTIKTLAMTAVDDGSLDSVQRIRVIDEIFGTDMLLKLK